MPKSLSDILVQLAKSPEWLALSELDRKLRWTEIVNANGNSFEPPDIGVEGNKVKADDSLMQIFDKLWADPRFQELDEVTKHVRWDSIMAFRHYKRREFAYLKINEFDKTGPWSH